MTIQLRRDTAANWSSVNPVLASGQPGYDTTNKILKIGDGSVTWSSLPQIGGTGTVTTVSVATANGFSGSVANATTTPAITITLQDANGSQAGKLTASDWNTFNSKQSALVSGTNIKTVNGNSLLGSGNLVISAGGVTAGTSTVSFGVTETNEAQLVVTGQTGILAGSKVVASIGTTATSDYTANDHKYLGSIGVSVTTGNVIAGTGFTIFVRSYQKVKGDISINWVY